MGFLRGLGKFLGSTLFTTFLVLAILLMDLVSFTSYDNIKLVVNEIIEPQISSAISEQDLDTIWNLLILQCSQTDKVDLPILGGQPVTLKCSDVKSSDKAQLPSLITASLVNSIYYKEFDCSFIDCITKGDMQNLLIVASNEGNKLFKSWQIYSWIGTGIGLALLLVATKTWAGRLKGVGSSLVFVGLPFLLLDYAMSFFIPAELMSSVAPLIDNLTSSMKTKFLIVLVVGAILLVAGYGLGFYLSRRGKKK